MIVDGQTDFVGSNSGRAIQAASNAAKKPKASVLITHIREEAETTKVRVQVDRVTGLGQGDAYRGVQEAGNYARSGSISASTLPQPGQQ